MSEEILAATIRQELGPVADTIQHFMLAKLNDALTSHELTTAVLQDVIIETMENFHVSEKIAWVLSFGVLRTFDHHDTQEVEN